MRLGLQALRQSPGTDGKCTNARIWIGTPSEIRLILKLIPNPIQDPHEFRESRAGLEWEEKRWFGLSIYNAQTNRIVPLHRTGWTWNENRR